MTTYVFNMLRRKLILYWQVGLYYKLTLFTSGVKNTRFYVYSVQRLAAGWMIGCSNFGGDKKFLFSMPVEASLPCS